MRKYLTIGLAAFGLAGSVAPSPVQAQAGDPILGQMLTVGFSFCPRGWSPAEGQILPINQNQSLYSLLGTTYGGDGRTTFALPDLRSRVNVGTGDSTAGGSFSWGQRSGQESVTLNASNLAAHTHTITSVKASSSGAAATNPTGAFLAQAAIYNPLGTADAAGKAGSAKINNTGGNQSVDIRMTYQTIKTCIAMTGVFPSRN